MICYIIFTCNGSDKMTFFDKQIKVARDIYNYFFIKLIFSIWKVFFKLSILLIIVSFFDYVIINIIALLYTFYSFYGIFRIYVYYKDIINDIKNTLGYKDFAFELDFNLINRNIFKGVLKYGK